MDHLMMAWMFKYVKQIKELNDLALFLVNPCQESLAAVTLGKIFKDNWSASSAFSLSHTYVHKTGQYLLLKIVSLFFSIYSHWISNLKVFNWKLSINE